MLVGEANNYMHLVVKTQSLALLPMTVTPSTPGFHFDSSYFSHEQKGGEGQLSAMSGIEVSGGEYPRGRAAQGTEEENIPEGGHPGRQWRSSSR